MRCNHRPSLGYATALLNQVQISAPTSDTTTMNSSCAYAAPVSPLPVCWWMTSYGATPTFAIHVVSHCQAASTHSSGAPGQDHGALPTSVPASVRPELNVCTRDPSGPGNA